MAGMIRTTTALTIVEGGHKENVMPDSASGTVNLRILPGESVATVIRRVKKIACGAVDGGVSIQEVNGAVFEPVPASSTEGDHWNLLKRLAHETWPDAIVAPYLMTATTDSRWFRGLTGNIYRFIPIEIGAGELAGVHSADEFVSLAAWEKSVDFLEKVISSD
jgi:carboxypeptidase PM20D1